MNAFGLPINNGVQQVNHGRTGGEHQQQPNGIPAFLGVAQGPQRPHVQNGVPPQMNGFHLPGPNIGGQQPHIQVPKIDHVPAALNGSHRPEATTAFHGPNPEAQGRNLSSNIMSSSHQDSVKHLEDHYVKLLNQRTKRQEGLCEKRKEIEQLEGELTRKKWEYVRDEETLKELDKDINRMEQGLSGAKAMQSALSDIGVIQERRVQPDIPASDKIWNSVGDYLRTAGLMFDVLE